MRRYNRQVFAGIGGSNNEELFRTRKFKYAQLAECTDRLTWDGFVEGRIAREWGRVVKPMLSRTGRRCMSEKWGAQLVDKLARLIHRQWIPRNTEIHFKLPDGWTLARHEEMFEDAL